MELVSIKDAALHLGISDQSVSRMIAAGLLQAHRVGKKRVMVSSESLGAYITSSKINPANEVKIDN